ncbi:DEAD/DEAH box helicase [Akkermansiaceae bacterium]|nr:DEAD/DEAH box helicase [Akkermansiaceae bacterium]MDB4316998.1 DEAD/DEAH box helicase [Akkermansiaceae bacterium]MDB4499331.1 DEAD/DEAH box helicase [Akkermansiaceae bacterium]
MGLSSPLAEASSDLGFSEPTPIQAGVIPEVLAGKDVLGIAKTGSGKTASYVLPILQKATSAKHREPEVLVLVPTRELADQVRQVFEQFLPALPERLRCLAIFGGVAINPQMQEVGKADIIVATPGRLLDLVSKNALTLSAVKTLVLDEADKMLNLGFKKEVDALIALLPTRRQNLLFSATLSPALTSIQQVILRDPSVIEIDSDETEAVLINEIAYAVTEERKGPLLRYLINKEELKQVLVFTSSAVKADAVVNKLTKNRINSASIHSKMSQTIRREVLQDFKDGTLRVLVATDLLARGVDIDSLPCVINYELPRSPKDYVHRIGRTGRAGESGDAISLVNPDEEHHFKVIQKKIGQRLPLTESADLNLHGF